MDLGLEPVVVDLSVDFFTTDNVIRGPVIGRGMTGEVVLAINKENPSIQRAAKMFSLLTPDGGIKNVRLFNHESATIQRLSHQHIIRHIVSYRCPDYLLICTEYCSNGSLTSKLRGLTSELKTKYFLQMLSAVNYLNNEQRIIHNDIKPSNILINDSNDAVLSDFGLSFAIPPNTRSVPTRGIGGTLQYSAPEKDLCSSVDPLKLDAFSLGAVLFRMLFKRRQACDSMTRMLTDMPLMMSLEVGHRLALCGLLDPNPSKRLSVAELIQLFVSRGIYPSFFTAVVPDHDRPETGLNGALPMEPGVMGPLPQVADVDSSEESTITY